MTASYSNEGLVALTISPWAVDRGRVSAIGVFTVVRVCCVDSIVGPLWYHIITCLEWDSNMGTKTLSLLEFEIDRSATTAIFN